MLKTRALQLKYKFSEQTHAVFIVKPVLHHFKNRFSNILSAIGNL